MAMDGMGMGVGDFGRSVRDYRCQVRYGVWVWCERMGWWWMVVDGGGGKVVVVIYRWIRERQQQLNDHHKESCLLALLYLPTDLASYWPGGTYMVAISIDTVPHVAYRPGQGRAGHGQGRIGYGLQSQSLFLSPIEIDHQAPTTDRVGDFTSLHHRGPGAIKQQPHKPRLRSGYNLTPIGVTFLRFVSLFVNCAYLLSERAVVRCDLPVRFNCADGDLASNNSG
ncbi:hypothetical protein P167DRAFT_548431 [Morchella conica CCBAS932]|uniref:Uncharacterized protein n=1 Tax=Morchella conica CCBAS932 TaxID=1392247 RepID=A0A3N4KEX4_9PEZI|nr:hypothetical protein P167DRAFT_548431 [Morchella conica CCBAS932]